MTEPEQSPPGALTRRQLRELRNTASTPIVTAETTPPEPAPVVAPLPRAAEPVQLAPVPPADAEVDLSAPALTRRAARQQERIRTASIPVITGEQPTAAEEQTSPDAEPVEPAHDGDEEIIELFEVPSDPDAEPVDEVEHVATATDADEAPEADNESAAESGDVDGGVFEAARSNAEDIDDEEPHQERPLVSETFGAGLLTGDAGGVDLPPSFDQLLTRGSASTGALSAPNALILSQSPDTGSFVSPVTATGEILITGTFSLPQSFGSTGILPGSSDGRDVDAVLIDGELPATSSPTPIAASSAISTIKSAEDVIRPPAPEKGSRLMLALVITAGALALALTGVLIVALLTGAFSS